MQKYPGFLEMHFGGGLHSISVFYFQIHPLDMHEFSTRDARRPIENEGGMTK